MECLHGLEHGCVLCKEGPTVKKAKVIDFTKVDLAEPSDGAKHDPDVAIAQAVAAGVICSECLTSTLGRGCHCSRRQVYDFDTERGYQFLAEAIETSGLTPREAAGLATAMQRRAGRLASLTPDTMADGAIVEGEQSTARLEVLERFNIDPKWFVAHRHEQDHLPV